MAITWCEHCDGVEIFPKLPVYLRSYHATFERNARVRDAVKLAERGNDALRALNAATLAATAAAAIGGEAAVVEPPDGEPANGTSAARSPIHASDEQ